jgi:uncharacterized coiled-coil protein SlyX
MYLSFSLHPSQLMEQKVAKLESRCTRDGFTISSLKAKVTELTSRVSELEKIDSSSKDKESLL